GIDDMPTRSNRNINAAPVDMSWNAQHHFFRRIAEPVAWPSSPDLFWITTYAARCNDYTVSKIGKFANGIA
ncbi:hypothetical protein NL487_27015, partial [Klebsiella pneumoniae]|nr:hypothetical protein [Klebsiella pneumoniae]